ncbi:hypothetical protein B0H14DRAFT_2968868, partial [Mycena olivaceomarginata]
TSQKTSSNPPPEEPSAFRTILLGDLDLIKEIHLDNESGVTDRQKRGGGVRRMYSAKIVGGESRPMTVAVYQGDGAEESWRQQVARYESIRHPHIMQLFGLVKTRGLRGMVFLNELIPFRHFLNRFEYSRILASYILAYCVRALVVFFSVTSGLSIVDPTTSFRLQSGG